MAVGIPEHPPPPFFRSSRERHFGLIVEAGRILQPVPPGHTPTRSPVCSSLVYNTPDRITGVFLLDFLGMITLYKLPNAFEYSLVRVPWKVI